VDRFHSGCGCDFTQGFSTKHLSKTLAPLVDRRRVNRIGDDLLKPYETGYDISNDLFGWEQIADRVEAIRAQMPQPDKTFVFCHRFFMTSQLSVYLSPDTVATSLHHRFNQYRFWFSADKHAGWDALFVVGQKRHGKRAQRYRPLFAKMDPDPSLIRIFRDVQPAHQLAVYRYFGFKGEYENLN
jgi:hypothetical protein